ncbi:bifunctional phosphopantothenoylcysteine decarboxylase/phosphopantothenate--cysteine ligase CoaBC [Desulfuribacillus stibiiarsenatis]|uniref:bifunctional phosphopantothenoylcysteine decarboxylase/phosphopantothenate--cysteine ligase CoaBC n=1 Tax=Desulfuribacillus stibiiarsenatis TaxID=1390249 RepID=UPI000B248729|nr:bifunctional phosphopantothenoylcysteine decarboxylase/phosphopantothenate--cysteine ligase CoaBC [Desulfuribacillus stibiiarsenatis]
MKRVVIGVTGGIAAYKVANICSKLKQNGNDVRVMMTQSATEFITPLTFQSLTGNRVISDTFETPDAGVSHIEWAEWADCILIAPATANIIGKVRHGIADDFVSTILMATRKPVLFAPAMNVHMYENPIVQSNIQELMRYGYHFIEPDEGYLACGYHGKGRLADENKIINAVNQLINIDAPNNLSLHGKHILITAGPTQEAIDPVRYISNYSSGKMGYALAEAAVILGAKVMLISGPTNLAVPKGVSVIQVITAEQMLNAVLEELPRHDIVIKSAAVADYRPKQFASQKIKKTDGFMTIELEKNSDILLEIKNHKLPHQVIVGFAAESENVIDNAKSKLLRKDLDMIVANDISHGDSGFMVDNNKVTILTRSGQSIDLPLQSKQIIARRILEQIQNKE